MLVVPHHQWDSQKYSHKFPYFPECNVSSFENSVNPLLQSETELFSQDFVKQDICQHLLGLYFSRVVQRSLHGYMPTWSRPKSYLGSHSLECWPPWLSHKAWGCHPQALEPEPDCQSHNLIFPMADSFINIRGRVHLRLPLPSRSFTASSVCSTVSCSGNVEF